MTALRGRLEFSIEGDPGQPVFCAVLVTPEDKPGCASVGWSAYSFAALLELVDSSVSRECASPAKIKAKT